MPEPTLSITLDEIRREVARFFSFGRDYASLTVTQQEDVDSVIRRGLRQFYQPPPVPGFMSHQWSFLRPTVSFSTVAGQALYQLPSDYGAMVDTKLTYDDRKYVPGPPIVSEYQFRMVIESANRRSGLPAYATVRPRTANGSPVSPTRWDIELFPAPDSIETYQYQYYVTQDAITSGIDHPAGAAVHGETILASVLAIAEEYVVSPTTAYRQVFRERLISSISMDRSSRGGGIIGSMRPTGDPERVAPPRIGLVTYDGMTP
jgi:hypothetical protein